MEINKIIIIYESHKLKNHILQTTLLPYKDFIEGYYTQEIREKNTLKGYDIIFLNGEKILFASKEENFEIKYEKYSINKNALEKVSKKILNYITTENKIILLEVGPMFIKDNEFTFDFLKILSSDKKILIFSPKNKEIIKTLSAMDDSFVMELTKKHKDDIKKYIDRWLGELITRMVINE